MHFTLGVVVEYIFNLYDRVDRYVQVFVDYEILEEGLSRCEGYGRYGDEINHRVKIDGFETGGRWRGSLLVKAEVTDYYLSPPWESGENQELRKPVEGYRWVDAARIRDIEWEKMLELEHPIKFYAFVGLDEDWMATEINEHKAFVELLEDQDEDCFLVVTDCHV